MALEERHHEVYTEKFVLSMLKNPSVIKLHCSFQDKHKLYFLMDFMTNGSLFDLLRREHSINLHLARHYSAEIVVALEALREAEIVHRDLKPGNLMLDESYHLKLIDFQTAKIMNPKFESRVAK